MQRLLPVFLFVSIVGLAHADDAKPLPPIKPIPRLLPPAGVAIPKEERAKLEARLAATIKLIQEAKLDEALKPDVEIYTKAVRWALDFDEFYDAKKDVAKAHAALDSAQKRLDELKQNKSSWTTQRGLLARGYRSDIDDSVQPYGLHIPANLDLSKPVPLLVWLHGRGDKETDLHFIATREKNKGEFAPDWCITLHPDGRGTIGFKFAGEIDVLDAIESVKKRYKIDDDRIALAGFSMGGAGAWHIGAHYADRFCVVHAGAGFVETAKYNKLTPDNYPSWYEQKLWGWYDVPNYTRNLFNVPVIAYSGEKDKQIQAAREMEAAFKAEGRELNHIIGPGFEHKYEPKAKEEILKQIKAAVDKGREKWPKKVSLQTRSLRYQRLFWIGLATMDKQWEEARIDAEWDKDNSCTIKTTNVADLWVEIPPSLDVDARVHMTVDGQKVVSFRDTDLRVPLPRLRLLSRREGTWISNFSPNVNVGGALVVGRTKLPSIAGPIDDAFMRPFLIVLPTEQSKSPRVQRWIEFESAQSIERWRALFRGDPRVKKDIDVTEQDMQKFNVVAWGDANSNQLIARAFPTASGVDSEIGGQKFSSSNHVVVQVRALNSPTRATSTYIVFNSGPTFREGHDRTNSQQTPKLPDWAIIGLDKDPDAFAPGEIKAAGFFDENWRVKAEEKK